MQASEDAMVPVGNDKSGGTCLGLIDALALFGVW